MSDSPNEASYEPLPTEAFANLLRQSGIGLPSGNTCPELDRQIMHCLLEFTRFSDTGDQHDPFDDPYVGAAIFTSDYRLLGAYRKKNSGERHSEPESIIEALRSTSDKRADELINAILEAYRHKIWLQPTKIPTFEKLFSDAGDFIKKHSSTGTLVIFSTLEPCGLYEANPSCANIIAACGVGRVLYASDDTNPKGRGRPILEERGVNVLPNMMINEAVSINGRFFAAVNINTTTYRDFTIKRLFGGAPYCAFRESSDLFVSSIGEDDRISVEPRTPFAIEYVGPEHSIVSPYISPREIEAFEKFEIEHDSTFFYGGESLGELSKILYRHTRNVGKLPSRIITSLSPFDDISSDDRDLAKVSEILHRRLVSIKQNAFRKHYEFWNANRHLMLAGFRSEFKYHVTALLKIAFPDDESAGSAPYVFLFCHSDALVEELEKACAKIDEKGGHAARITILANATAHTRLSGELHNLRERMKRVELFRLSSFEVGLVPPFGPDSAKDEMSILERDVEALTDVTISCLKPQDLGIGQTARQLDEEIRSGRRDPNFFDPDYIEQLSGGVDWIERKSAGTISGQLAKSSREYAEEWVLAGLARLAQLKFGDRGWTEACSKLNAIRNASEILKQHHGPTSIKVLIDVAISLDQIASDSSGTDAPIWFEDVAWRWLACWFEFYDEALDFSIPSGLIDRIVASPFLLSSSVRYSFRSKNSGAYKSLAAILDRCKPVEPASEAASIAAARLVAERGFEAGCELSFAKRWLYTFRLLGDWQSFREEYRRCLEARTKELSGFTNKVDASPEERIEQLPLDALKFVRSHVAQRALGDRLGRVGKNDEFEPDLAPLKAWREDYRVILEEVISFTPVAWQPAILLGLAGDTDVNLRWATVYLALNQPWVEKLFGRKTVARDQRISNFRRNIVKVARDAGHHYWIEREVLGGFLRAHGDNALDLPGNLSREFPSAAGLGLDQYLSEDGAFHPELQKSISNLRRRCKKILLILPPIKWPPEGRKGSAPEKVNEGTPPLGLGQISAALSSGGHYVEVIDAHRFSYDLSEVSSRALEFDFVGISSVFSTLEATHDLTIRISRMAKGKSSRPCIVIGGHAATLNASRILQSQSVFDWLVIGPGEQAFLDIVGASLAGRDVTNPLVISSTDDESRELSKGKIRKEAAEVLNQSWDELPLIDRTVFKGPSGELFEPSLTRDRKSREAHIVMSKGCDWKCSFCTEAILGGPRETRRRAESVVREVEAVSSMSGANHIQFIDDNVFPPLAAPGLRADEIRERSRWTQDFLGGLGALRKRTIRSEGEFNWRGILRLEDLIAYSREFPNFANQLHQSGCTLLAFGVEHGNEGIRRALKLEVDETPTNSEIVEIVQNLHEAKIMSKAYFIIGGPHDSRALAQETIDFSITSGVDLAYFAIFKDFRNIQSRASKADQGGGFEKLSFDLQNVSSFEKHEDWEDRFGSGLRMDPADYLKSLSSLKEMNFSFKDLFKYSDIHAEQSFDFLYFGDREEYVKTLRRAYLEFYARDNWVNVYSQLLSSGY